MSIKTGLSFLFSLFLCVHASASWPLKGVCYDANWENKEQWYGTPAAENQLKKLETLGVNAISFTPFAFQEDVHKPNIRVKKKIDRGLKKDIEWAKALGYKVIFKPHIWSNQFWDGSGNWRGTIEMDSEADWKTWFDQYETVMIHFAQQAADLDVDILVIGLEYVKATQKRKEEWMNIINSIRYKFGGKLTYAANGLEEARQIDFWDQLDYIGVNAYFPLTKEKDPLPQNLRKGLWKRRADLQRLAHKHKKKIILTELGYASVDGTNIAPHRWPKKYDQLDLEEQAQCYEAFFNVFEDASWLEGIFIWKYKVGVTQIEDSKEPSEAHFVFQDKPAEKIIKKYFLDPGFRRDDD